MNYSKWQLSSLVVLRMTIGWHFLYEGVVKLFNPYWTSKGYLLSSEGIFQPFFVWLTGDSMLGMVDFLNVTVILVVGMALMLGSLTRIAAIAGIALLLLFYLAHPPLHGMKAVSPIGSFWIVNYNLIEIAGLLVVYLFPTGRYFGLDYLIGRKEND
jgi:thiosulfate dehydrogenase [quinone] large subunit